MLPKFPFRHDFDQGICLAPGDVPSDRNSQHATGGFTIAMADRNFIVWFYGMGRLCRTAVEQNKTRIAKLLSNRSARAEAAKF